ncbi:MAG: hypothetical protein FWF10_01480 [Clostridiales bacterium]|nr:hypothetical protein [Clostridiales bacterium]
MKKTICIILCTALVCLAFASCKADKNDPFTLHETPQIYVLEGEDAFMYMPFVTLYENGNAQLSQPMISSLALFDMGRYEVNGDKLTVTHGSGASCTFAVSDGGDTLTLIATNLMFTQTGLVYTYRANGMKNSETTEGEALTLEILRNLAQKAPNLTVADFEGYAHVHVNGDPDIHLFDIGGEYTLTVVLDADGYTSCTIMRNASGERFPLHLNGSTGLVFDAFLGITEIAQYETREWLDYFMDNDMPWNDRRELTLPEFPGVVFTWTVVELYANGEALFGGWPVWNVFLADLTNDGKPEFCATVSYGFGMIDERVIVYDYAEGKLYMLEDRGTYNYRLYIDDGQMLIGEGKLVITRTDYRDNLYLRDDVSAVTTELRIVNGEIFRP